MNNHDSQKFLLTNQEVPVKGEATAYGSDAGEENG